MCKSLINIFNKNCRDILIDENKDRNDHLDLIFSKGIEKTYRQLLNIK